MTMRKEKIRKLRALARSPNRHKAALALAKAKAKALEHRNEEVTAKEVARAIVRLLEARGLSVRVRPRNSAEWSQPKTDAEVHYFCSRDRHVPLQIKIEVTEYQ
jgi:hypothetical protein